MGLSRATAQKDGQGVAAWWGLSQARGGIPMLAGGRLGVP